MFGFADTAVIDLLPAGKAVRDDRRLQFGA